MSQASLITHPLNCEYLTGFRSSKSFLLNTPNKSYLFTDARYFERATKINFSKILKRHLEIKLIDKQLKATLTNLSQKHQLSSLTYEASHLTVAQFKQFKKLFKKIRWVENSLNTEKLRAIKSTSEIVKIRKSQTINEQIFYSLRGALSNGVSELDIALMIKRLSYQYGADGISFEPIIAFGNHTSIPHHENTNRKLKRGDLILIDMGILYKRYASDMTRMLFTKAPTKQQETIYNLVLEAQEKAIINLKPKQIASKLYKIANDHFKIAGLATNFTHALGHGIGLEVHELPNLAVKGKEVLKPGMIVTCEPGLYFPNKFGIRIEDMLLITKTGSQNLTKVPKLIKDCVLS
ncbi:MAG: aminopeptidase YpdF, Xaa-Pro aminopeptidase [Candidatus Peregrinibacteria bacterium GW2011_GWE2_39_6]|nr:MAG: aminopeptidase YpdF, Xaa-Pro aminopeptidase [Candidatus Peregrinibacteria bacterium GW2011_GWF2_39_17]KKR24418.1 MAG: aminopeptidase YpdF, Xaa-Pro aminopeptidase [Candidatus Peregrinibacteria bacterium GW2011_GWE2_39_6]HCW32001.1 hypothetical protein [Candidatus Peregrinibacteria bacterium]